MHITDVILLLFLDGMVVSRGARSFKFKHEHYCVRFPAYLPSNISRYVLSICALVLYWLTRAPRLSCMSGSLMLVAASRRFR